MLSDRFWEQTFRTTVTYTNIHFSYTNTQGTYTYIQIYCDAPPAEQLWKMKVRLGSQSRPKLYMMMTGIPGGGLHPSIYIYIPGTQMTPVLIGKGLVLGRLTFKTSKVDVIGALYFSPSLSLYIYRGGCRAIAVRSWLED